MAIRSLSAHRAPTQNTNVSGIPPESASSVARRTKYRLARRLLAVGYLGFAFVSSSGCSMIGAATSTTLSGSCECIDDFMVGYRNRAMAEKAWFRNKHRFCNHQYMSEFKDGFIQGYLEVASGGNGCIPAIAPSDYWGWKYQSSNGHCAVNAWFEGFPMGVQAAEQDGVGHWQQLRTSGIVPPTAPLAPAIQMNNSGVTNPFYSEEEIIPAPEPMKDEDGESGSEGDVELEMREPESVFNEAFPPFPVVESINDDAELVSQSDIAKLHEAAVAARLGDQPEASSLPAEVVIEDLFGPQPAGAPSDSDELPFSFE